MFSFISRSVLVVSSSIPFVNYVYWSPEISVICLHCQIHKYSTLVFIQKKRTRWIYGRVCVCIFICLRVFTFFFLYSAQHHFIFQTRCLRSDIYSLSKCLHFPPQYVSCGNHDLEKIVTVSVNKVKQPAVLCRSCSAAA